MSYASSDDARRRWREFLNAVEHKGEHVILQRYGRPAAAVVPVDWYEQAKRVLGIEQEKS